MHLLPTLNPYKTKDKLFEDVNLNPGISNIPNANKLVMLKDFGARVGNDCIIWEGTNGHHGNGNASAMVDFSGHLQNLALSIQKPSSAFQPVTRHPRCIPGPNTGISLTMSSSGRG